MSGAEMQSLAFTVWMVVSAIAFVAIIAWALWPGHRERFEAHAAIPFLDDEDRP